MMLIVLTVLVGVVQSKLMCTYSDFKHQAFAEITEPTPAVKLLLQIKHRGIANTACATSYRVKYNDGLNPYYYFRIDQGGFISYAAVTWDFTSRYIWRKSTKEEFEKNLEKCYNEDNGSPQVPLVPQCNINPVPSKLICTYDAYEGQTFREITNTQVRAILQANIRGIADTDCTLSYQVRDYNRGNLFFPIRIDTGRLTFYGILTWDHSNKVSWNPCTKEEFEKYLKVCDGEMPWRAPPQVPPVLSCGRRPNHHVHFETSCRWSGFDLQPFRNIINPSLRVFILSTLRGLADTDCTLSYKVQKNDGSDAFYPFRIDQGRLSHYGIVRMDSRRNKFVLKGCTKEQFESYLDECYSGDMEYRGRPQVPTILQCSTDPSNGMHFEHMCYRREFVWQSFEEITNPSIQRLLQSNIKGLDESACTLSYRVSDALSSYYYYRVDQGRYSYYGQISVDSANNYRWRESTKEEFSRYIRVCYKEVPDVLQCKKNPPKSMCKHSGFLQLTINQLPDQPLRELLMSNIGTDSSVCTLSYQVRYNGQNTFYPFIVELQNGTRVYSKVTADYENGFAYRSFSKQDFEQYLTLCDGGVPPVPPVLRCRN